MIFWCHILKLNLLILLFFMFQGALKGPPLEFPFWPNSVRPRYIPFNCQPSIKVVLVSFIRKLRKKKIRLQCDSSFMWDPETKDFLVAQMVKHLSTMQETWVRSLGQEDPLEKEMAIHSSTFAWKIQWTEEPGRLQSMGWQRVRHDWATSLSLSETKNGLIHNYGLYPL